MLSLMVVSILVLLDFVLKAIMHHTSMRQAPVSILVLLDFVLKDQREYIRRDERWRFNPCFIGFCS